MLHRNKIVEIYHRDPGLTSFQIAKDVGCGPGEVIAVLRMERLPLPRRVTTPIEREREACAALAEEMGAPEVAAAIRARKLQ